jgi:DNA-binding response OmpR family regulator
MGTSDSRETFRFGDFELDVAAYELRRHGRPVKLERRPMDLLIQLVESRHQLVSRSDIVDRLWGNDVFVDVETGINTAISKGRLCEIRPRVPRLSRRLRARGIASSRPSRPLPVRASRLRARQCRQ